jgi:hypothetical protein
MIIGKGAAADMAFEGGVQGANASLLVVWVVVCIVVAEEISVTRILFIALDRRKVSLLSS